MTAAVGFGTAVAAAIVGVATGVGGAAVGGAAGDTGAPHAASKLAPAPMPARRKKSRRPIGDPDIRCSDKVGSPLPCALARRYHTFPRAATLAHAMRETDSWADTLDPSFARLWADFSGGLERRAKLDERTRLLVAVGQCVATGEIDEMAGFVQEALTKQLDPREILEVILQAAIYVGKPKTNRAARAFIDVATRLGMPLGTPPEIPKLKIDQERRRWRISDDDFPRRDELMRKYGWHGHRAGLRTQPGADALPAVFAHQLVTRTGKVIV